MREFCQSAWLPLSEWARAVSDDVGSADPGLVGLLVGEHGLALALGLDPAQVVVDLLGGAGLVPVELTGHQSRGGAGCVDAAVKGLDRDGGTASEEVGGGAGALVGAGGAP